MNKELHVISISGGKDSVVLLHILMYIQKDFREELRLSLSIKSNEPLGEDEIGRLIKYRDNV